MDITYTYPSNTPGASSASQCYYHRLGDQASEALQVVQRWVIDNDIDMSMLSQYGLHPTLTLLRYLRTNKLDTEKAIEHIKRNINWRRENNVALTISQTPEDILGCNLMDLMKVFPHWHCGYDKTGRPVMYKHYGSFDVSTVKKLTTIDSLLKYHIWEQEQSTRLCTAESHKRKEIIETLTSVIDVKDMRMSQVTRDFLSIVKSLAAIDQAQYPETLGRIFIINTPSAFPFVWRMVKPWLDPDVAAKIQVLGSQSEYQPVLFDFIGKENLPSNYGGILEPLSNDRHPYQSILDLNAKESAEKLASNTLMEESNVVPESILSPERNVDLDVSSIESERQFAAVTVDATVDAKIKKKHKGLRYFRSVLRGKHRKSKDEDVVSEVSSPSELTGDDDDDEDLEFSDASEYNEEIIRGTDLNVPVTPATESQKHYDWSGELKYFNDIEKRSAIQMERIQHHSRKFSGDTNQAVVPSSPIPSKPTSPYSTQTPTKTTEKETKNPVVSIISSYLPINTIAYICKKFYSIVTLENWLGKKTPKEIKPLLSYSILLHMSLSLSALVLSAYLLTSIQWVSAIAVVQMWTGIVVLLMSISLVVLNFTGFGGNWYENRPILIMYASCLSFAVFILLIVGILSFLYATSPEVSGLGNVALRSAFSDSESQAKTMKLIKQYNLILGGGCLMIIASSILPIAASITLQAKLRSEQPKDQTPTQLRTLLKVAQAISLCSALVMLCYGGASLNYLFRIHFATTVFPVYGLIYGGASVILGSILGLWVSNTLHKSVVRAYYMFVLPLVILLLVTAACVSFGSIKLIESKQLNTNPTADMNEKDNAKLVVQTQLLVSGILCSFVCLFQLVSLFASKRLNRLMMKDKNFESFTDGQNSANHGNTLLLRMDFLKSSRTTNDRILITWAIMMGLYHIYFEGTFVIMSSLISNIINQVSPGDSFSIAVVWQNLALLDERYMGKDAYFVCSEALLAFIVGPLLLFYAWTIFVKAPYRHVLGIVSTVLEIEMRIIFLAIEFHNAFVDVNRSRIASVAVMYTIIFIVFIIIPTIVLVREALHAVQGISQSDTHNFLVNANKRGKKSHVHHHHLKKNTFQRVYSFFGGIIGRDQNNTQSSLRRSSISTETSEFELNIRRNLHNDKQDDNHSVSSSSSNFRRFDSFFKNFNDSDTRSIGNHSKGSSNGDGMNSIFSKYSNNAVSVGAVGLSLNSLMKMDSSSQGLQSVDNESYIKGSNPLSTLKRFIVGKSKVKDSSGYDNRHRHKVMDAMTVLSSINLSQGKSSKTSSLAMVV